MSDPGIRLIMRADDMGSSWASNEGCLKACLDGVATSIEVMMPCAWVRDGANRLNQHPQIDVGIHLTLTSEWEACKWRPLTHAPTLTDENGDFYPLLTPRPGDGRPSLSVQNWSLNELIAELKAQVILGKRLFPQASHISSHMIRHFRDFDPRLEKEIAEMCRLANLKNDPLGSTVPHLRPYPKEPIAAEDRERAFIDQLKKLDAGTYIAVDHPAVPSADMQAIGHVGYRNVSEDRKSCLKVFTSPTLRAAIARLGIQLISYKDL